MTYYKVEMYNYKHGFSVFVTIAAIGPRTAQEKAEYLLEQMWKNPDDWMINSIIEEENF